MMRNVKWLPVMIVGLCSTAVLAESLEEIEKQITKKLAEIRSMTADIKTDMDMSQSGMEMKMVIKGKTSALFRDGKYYSRQEGTMDRKMKFGDQPPQEESGKTLIVTDGEFTWMLMEQGGQPMCMKQKIQDVPSLGTEFFKSMRETYELTAAKTGSAAGAKTWEIHAKPKEQQQMGPAPDKFIFHFRQSDGVMTQMDGYMGEKKFMTTTIQNIKVNIDMKPDQFKFEVPDGVQVMDMTNQ